MNLQQFYRDLENSVKDHTLTLKKDAKVPAEVLRVLGGLPEPQLVIHQADLVLDKKSLPPVLSVSGSTVGNWPILGVADSSLRPTSVSLTVTDSGGETLKVDAKLDGTIAVGKSELPVQGSLTEQGTWALRLADDKQRVSFADLISWAGGSNALASLTSQCTGLPVTNPASIEDFSLELGLGSEPQSFLSCQLAVVGRLKILQGLPAVDLRSAGMSVTHYPSSTKTPQSVFAFGLRTYASIGGGNCVVAFRNLGGIGDAVAKIIPDDGQGFPALHDLAALVGAADLSSSFQQTIQSLGLDGFAITGVDISFDAKSGVPSFVSVSGKVQIAGVTVDVFFGLPDFRLSGQLSRGQLDVVSLIKHFWAGAPSLPSLSVSGFAISTDVGTRSLALYGEVADTWQIDFGATKLTVGNIALNFNHTGTGQPPKTTARVTGITKIQGVEVDISTDLSDVVTLRGVIPRMNLTAIVKEFLNGISIPAELPDFELFDIKLSATPATGAFFISGRSSGEWGFSTGGGGMNITDVGFSLGRADAKVGIDCSIQITGKGPGQLAQGLSFGDFELRFDLIDGDKWHVGGHLGAKLYAFEMRLAADFSGGGVSRTMSFSWSEKPAPTLLSIDNIASLSLSSFTVSIMHSAGDTGHSSSGFGITGTGKITIGRSLFVSDFDIKLSTEAENDKLLFIFEQPSAIEVSLGPVAGHEPVFELELSGIHIEADGNQKTWSMTTDAHGRLHNIPELVQDYFPKDLPDGRFCVNDKGVSFDCTLATPLRPQCRMFSVKVEGREVLPKISIAKIGARLGEKPAIRGTLHVELPEALNYFLGANPKSGKPNFVFLNPSFDLDLSIGKALSLSLANGTSPFKALNYKTDDKGNFLDWDFGEFGVFRVDIPTLSYEGNAWMGMAGVELPSPLKVPLTPIKYILGLLAFPENLLRYIPASVPVQAIDFTDLQGSLENLLGKNTVEQIKKDKLLAEPLEDFETISGQIKKIIHRLPADFEGYLKIPDLKELRLKLGASPGGGPIIGLHTDDEHPLKVMLPWFAGMPPGFLGVTLHSLDVGQTVGGATLVKVDGVIDQFDLISLVVAGSGIIPQEQARKLKNEITFGDATFILWPALPVPILLTYDTLNWDYQAWSGFKLFADWHLREKSNLFAIIASLIPFFSDPNAKLHEPPNKQDFELDLTIGPNYLALPDYLGGTVLGLKNELPTMDLAYGIKCFLDAMKFGNAGYLIQAVPLQDPKSGEFYRIGSQKGAAGFGPLKFEAALGWCITTENEFRSKIVPNKEAQKLLGELDADAILANLPAKSGPAFDKGFIVLLMARGGLAGILEYGTNFGIAVTSTGGFETKLMLQGSIADLLSLSLYGLIKVSQKGDTTVEGGCSLKFDKTELIGSKHTITVTNHSFELKAKLRLLDVVTLAGDFYIGQDQVYLKGVFSWGYAKGQASMGALSIFARFNNSGFEIGVGAGNLFGTKCAQLALYLDVNKQTPIGARAELDDLTGLNEKLGLSIKSYKGEIEKAAADAQELMNQAIAGLQNNIGGFEDLRKRLPGYLNNLRTKTIPGIINSRVKGAYEDLKWWQKAAVKESTINSEVQAYYRKNFAGRIQRLEDGLNNIKGGDEAAKNSQTRKLLQQTLQSVIDIGDIKYTYRKTVGKTFSKTVTIPDPVKPYRKQLQDLKNVIGKLPDSWDKAHAAEATYAAKDKIRQGISEVVKNIDKQTPQIESVQLDLPLVFTAPVVDAYVTLQYAGKSRLLKPVHLDLGNPVKSIDSITEAFANLLSADAG